MELAVAREYLLPHSEFLKWHHDDRDKAIWLHLREKARCKSCGTRAEEWNPEHGGDRHAYIAGPGHCPGCAELHRGKEAQKAYGPAIPGTFIALRKKG